MERPRRVAVSPHSSSRGDDRLALALAHLTPPQRAAVESTALPLCIVAGAGSGKTRVLTLRAAARIRDGTAEADHTVVCTFTRKATAELRGRLIGYHVPVSVPGPGRVPTPGVRVGTVHQLALTLIRRHCLDHGRDVPTVLEHRSLVLRRVTDTPATAAVLGVEIAWAKARGLTPDSYPAAVEVGSRLAPSDIDGLVSAFRAYEEALDRRAVLDLDDLLVRAADLLDTDDAFADRMRWRYRHLSVDEFQDVNPAQFRLLRTLLGKSPDLCVVGDPHQAIYGWNGADPTLLARLPELLGPITVLELAENHRSTPGVVDLADAVLGDLRRYRARSALADVGPPPTVTAYSDEAAEAEAVAESLLDRHGAGVPWSEQAVLARTHDQLSVVARALVQAGVPHRMGAATDESLERSTGEEGWGAELGPAGEAGAGEVHAVELATFHRAKGGEWTSVFVTGVEEGFVPIVYAVDDEARAEERRLLYVALTRAAWDLSVSWARRRTTSTGRVMERLPSPWLPKGAPTGSDATAAGNRTGTERAVGRIAGLRNALHGSR